MSEIVGRFLALNQSRLEKTFEIMPARHWPLIKVLPLLFHVNEPSFPGFAGDTAPQGIYGYLPEDDVQQAATKLWRNYQFKPKPFVAFDIDAIFLMGSCGTVAFNADSDFDVWICYQPGLKKEKIKLLQNKATEIEKWYEDSGLEVHFFLMNADAFKKGRVARLSSESSGSAQYHLLLDEFYRTSIWLAGKKPLWWEISPDQEKVYEKSKASLIKKGLIKEQEYIDFGGLPAIPKSEFFGAAVWQIYKGIDSPYKSVLKITLMEAYAESYPEINPLSAFFKKRVYEGETDSLVLDSYLLMFNRIDNYLRRKSELSRLETTRRSFYLKLSLPLSIAKEENSWRKKCVEELVYKDWCWTDEKIKRLDASKNWMIEDVIDERKLLVSHLTNSYTFLSKFARKHASRRLIKPKDLTILGRKLYSAFDRKAGKVEVFNRGIADNMAEQNVTIRLFFGKKSQEYWHIYRGKVIGDQYKNINALKQSFSLIELLVWSHVNKLISDSTQKLMYAPRTDISNSELNALLKIIEQLVGQGKSLTPKGKDLLKPAMISTGAAFVNLGQKPKVNGVNFDKKIISGEVDVFNYGGENDCMIESIEHLYMTSWKEIFVFKYSSADGMANWLCSALNMYNESLEHAGNELKISSDVYSFGSNVSHVVSTRVNDLYKSVIKSLLGSRRQDGIYVYQAGLQFYCISYENDHYDFDKFSNIDNLIDYLSLPKDEFRQVIFDSNMKVALPLREIYQTNKKDKIQLYCYEERENTQLFILDEYGALYYHVLPLDEVHNVLYHYVRFFDSILSRKNIDENDFDSEIMSAPIEDILEMYQISGSSTGFYLESVVLQKKELVEQLQIQVLGQQVDGKPVFTFYCDDIEFSSAEYGNKIFQKVASNIMQRRSGHSDYYLYITDLELSPALLGKKMSHKVQTIELLKYKKRIESKLNPKVA